MRFYSVIVPVYNRPDEIRELLESLTQQTYKNFEVIIVEDGSTIKCDQVVKLFEASLKITYYYKPNSGQGFSRNFGYERANGEYFIVFDSDCIIPSHYLEAVEDQLDSEYLHAFGGPDCSHPSFTATQKAISYSMTSFFTTGGIRGGKKRVGGVFHPRSFNMGISKEVFIKTKGYILPKMGEDIEFSIRIIKAGFKSGLIENAFVYHKRRTNFKQFYKQLHFFGRARINVFRHFKQELKLVHFMPACFTIFLFVTLCSQLLKLEISYFFITLLALYSIAIACHSTYKNRSLFIGLLSVIAAFTQLTAYGVGFITEGFREITSKVK